MTRGLALCLLTLSSAVAANAAAAEPFAMRVTVTAEGPTRENSPVWADFDVPRGLRDADPASLSVVVMPAGQAAAVPGQLEITGQGRARVWWIEPVLSAGDGRSARILLRQPAQADAPAAPLFAWRNDEDARQCDLLYGDRPVVRYMYAWDPDNREDTYKVYHHVFSPSGDRLITKGPGGMDSHHRGLFIGWKETTVAGKPYDFWHMADGSRQEHQEFIELVAGPVFARMKTRILWLGPDDTKVMEEERTLTAFAQPEPTALLQFESLLKPLLGDTELKGSLHFAGFHFRADNEVAGRRDETQFVLPEGAEKTPGRAVSAAWGASSFMLGDARYTVANLDHPDNPKPTEYSLREYGRFGVFFQTTIPSDEPLALKYRLFVHEGGLATPEAIASRYADFIHPPTVSANR